MFKKLVAIEPVSLIPTAEEALHQYAEQVELYRDIPADDEEIVRRIGDADAALLSYTSRMGKNVIERCPNLRYIGMCCSLYSEESANVDIAFAREKGIKVGLIRPITLWPFPMKEIAAAAQQVKAMLTVEMSMGQMVEDVRLAANGACPVSFFGRTGGIVPSPAEVLAEIEKMAGGAR